MFRRSEVAVGEGRRGAPGMTPSGNFVAPSPWPNFSGDLDGMLTTAPVFRTAVRGYDRLQVDNYVAWAEAELRALRRETDDLVDRYGHCSAELEISRRLLAQSPEGQELTYLSERMGTMLRLAADEAAELTAAGAAEAEQILADARTEADARLRKAHEIKQMTVEASDRIREEARLARAEAAAALDRATAEAAQLLRDAAAERARLDEEAARARAEAEAETARRAAEEIARVRREQDAVAARVATLHEEVEDLRRRREQERTALRQLTDQVGEAIDVLTGNRPADLSALAPAGERLIS